MKYFPYIFAVVILLSATFSCQQKEEDYHTDALVTLEVPDTLSVLEVQGTVSLKNISNGSRYASSEFTDTTVRIEVLRGAYMLDAEGTVRCRLADGTEIVRYFRGADDYVEIINHPARVSVKMIFM